MLREGKHVAGFGRIVGASCGDERLPAAGMDMIFRIKDL